MQKLTEKQRAWLFSGLFLLMIATLLLFGGIWMYLELGKHPDSSDGVIPLAGQNAAEIRRERQRLAEDEKMAREFARIPLALLPWVRGGPDTPYVEVSNTRSLAIPWKTPLLDPSHPHPLHNNPRLEPLPIPQQPWSAIPEYAHSPSAADEPTRPIRTLNMPLATLVWVPNLRPLDMPTLSADLPWPKPQHTLTLRPVELAAMSRLPWAFQSISPIVTRDLRPAALPWPDKLEISPAATLSASLPWPAQFETSPAALSTALMPWPTELQIAYTVIPALGFPWQTAPTDSSAAAPLRHVSGIPPASLPWPGASRVLTQEDMVVLAVDPWERSTGHPAVLHSRPPAEAQLPWESPRRGGQLSLNPATLPFENAETPLAYPKSRLKKRE